MEIGELIWKIIPAGAAITLFTAACRFYQRHLLDIYLHISSGSSYCYVLDSERNPSPGKSSYFAQFKAVVDISTGEGLSLYDVLFFVMEGKKSFKVSFSIPIASKNVEKFFDAFGKDWQVQHAEGGRTLHGSPGSQSLLTAQGVVQGYEPFSNLPEGGYRVLMVLVLKRFLVLVPCRFASSNDVGFSTISSSAVVHRRRGGSLDIEGLLDRHRESLFKFEGLCRLKIAILDFDFLPRLSLFKSLTVKKESVGSRDGADS
jgi:hypothetical protein